MTEVELARLHELQNRPLDAREAGRAP